MLQNIVDFFKGMWTKFNEFISSLTSWMMILTTIITGLGAWFVPDLYERVVSKSNVGIKMRFSNVIFNSELPTWIRLEKDSMYTNKALEHEDIIELRSLVSDTCCNYQVYVKDIGCLAYKSHSDTKNIKDLIWLTLCYVILGCSARTLYDFIGRKCYKDQDMKKWWPWYLFRPLICVPIATLLIVSVRTSIFSNLFVSKDLNTYLVISFVAGFAIMDFLTMLRRLSKSLFGASELKSDNEKKDEQDPNAK